MSPIISGFWDIGYYLSSMTGDYKLAYLVYFLIFLVIVSLIVEFVFIGLYGDKLRDEDVIANTYNGNTDPLTKAEITTIQYQRALEMVYYITNTLLLTLIAFCCVHMAFNYKK